MPVASKVLQYLERASWIRKMFEEGERLKAIYGPDRVFDFSLGNPVLEPPPAFRETLLEIVRHPVPGMHGYMSNAGYAETRRAVAEYLARETGVPLTENHVVMTCGAGGALNVALKALLDPGDEVIILAPYFVEYRFYIDNHGGVPVEVPTDENFLPDLEALGRAIGPRTKALILNSPNNPTGVVYGADVLAALGRLLAAREAELGRPIFVLSDEPYARLVYDGLRTPCIFHHVRHSIIANSYSKDLSLAGERIGYLAVNPEIEDWGLLVEALVFANRVLGFVNAPALMQRAVARLQGAVVDVAEYRRRRDVLYGHLTSLGFEMVKPQGGF
ncbi:MAG: pyridoxal phosphate-dependent aminotransferase, partial [Firmicutes bacterium]|nr:pyridoxal phosphate-dependent aminotransferase [Bacillota bacterium]